MVFEEVECVYAFYDAYVGAVFYRFETVPQIGHGRWAISEGGDAAWDLLYDEVMQIGYPEELLELIEYIPEDIEIEGIDDEDY